jgi:uncharacterized membrane protein
MSDWYYAANNEQKGPINESELKANFAANKLPADTLVWKDGMDNWTPANKVSAFTFRPAPTPAKVQPTMGSAATTKVAAVSPNVNNPSSTTPVDMSNLMGTPEALEVDADDAEKNKVMGILAYLGILCLIPILAAKDSPFAKYHANQGLVLFIIWIVLAVALNIIDYVLVTILPGGMGFIVFILSLAYLGLLILAILGIINAAAGKCVPLPVIGGIKLLK